MAPSQSSGIKKNKALYKYDSMVEYKDDALDDEQNQLSRESISANDEGVYQDRDGDGEYSNNNNNIVGNEHSLLLPDGGNTESDKEDYDEERAEAQRHLEYRHQNRFIILALVALTPSGVKFFKAAQSSFEEYLMNDPRILMSATTYSLSLSLMSLPVATLIGGAMLDHKSKREKRKKIDLQQCSKSLAPNCLRNPISGQQSCLGTSRTPSYSAIFFLAISLLGIIIYGYGLETLSSIPVGLTGATIFGLGEGCVVVASRTFVAHAFYGSDGAFAQGVLVAMNNIAMMASKISLPWLIENNKKIHSITSNCIHNVSLDCLEDGNVAFDHNMTIPSREYSADSTEHDDNNIWIGVVACCQD